MGCDFSKSLKQWEETVWLDGDQPKSDIVPFQSQVMASAPKALEKLDQKRDKLKSVLAQKLEKKQRHKEAKKVKDRCASAMLVNRRPDSRILQERSASAMTVLKEELKNTSNSPC